MDTRSIVAAICGMGAMGVSGCGDNPPPLPDTSTCAAGWTAITPPRTDPLLGPSAMTWADGVLYQAVFGGTDSEPRESSIIALPTNGGLASIVVEDSADSLWVDGANLLYSHSDELMQVPRSGGAATVVLDDTTVDPSDVQGHLLDETHFYWLTHDFGADLWRMPRAGGPAEKLGTTTVAIGGRLAFVSDGVLAVGPSSATGSSHWAAMVVPSSGGPVRSLADVFDPILADSTGAIWNALYVDSATWRHELRRSPANGGADERVPSDLPAKFSSLWGAPDGDGGYLLIGSEPFDDGSVHPSAFTLDADGKSRRIACNPSSEHQSIDSVAVAPDAIYASMNDFGGEGWTIVRIAR